jgi:hypothetical protein
MAIVIPVAIEGLQIASKAGAVAQRKIQAATVAEQVLNENVQSTATGLNNQSGSIMQNNVEYKWTLRSEEWTPDTGNKAPRMATVEVTYRVQSQEYVLRMSTLATTP